jgi:hypothetical protein
MRMRAKITEADVEKIQISRTKLWRIENGRVATRYADVKALAELYGADKPTVEALAALAAGTTGQGWWQDWVDTMPAWFQLYVGLENSCQILRAYEPELVPGLLQTPDYARAAIRAVRDDTDEEEVIERHVQLRMQRQAEFFDTEGRRSVSIVLGAGVLCRPIGGPAVMQAQILHLRATARDHHMDLRVLPWDAGAHAAMAGGFVVLGFPDVEDPDVVYVEAQTGGRYLEKPSEVREYERIYERVFKVAVPIEEYMQ